jgi:fermentation-respiration switch protein FrsA (DUF1100 family)
MRVLWSHGLDAAPWGAKISSLAEVAGRLGFEVTALDYRDLTDPDDRVDRLVKTCGELAEPLVLAGSSLGGYVSIMAAGRVEVRGLFLLAPALFRPGLKALPDVGQIRPVTMVHGWRDEVLPVDESVRFARHCRATLHIVDGDHRLKENIGDLGLYFRQFLEAVRAGDQGSRSSPSSGNFGAG